MSLGAEDQQLFDTSELRYALADVLRRVEADLVLAPPPVDYQADHVRAGRLPLKQSICLRCRRSCWAIRPCSTFPSSTTTTPPSGSTSSSSFYIDISDQIDKKRAMVAHHASQIRSGKAEHGWDLVDLVEILGRFRGLQAGVKYAEGFQPCLRWPRLRALSAFPF